MIIGSVEMALALLESTLCWCLLALALSDRPIFIKYVVVENKPTVSGNYQISKAFRAFLEGYRDSRSLVRASRSIRVLMNTLLKFNWQLSDALSMRLELIFNRETLSLARMEALRWVFDR